MKWFLILWLAFLPIFPMKGETNALTALQCLTANLYYEARGESELGMKAVAQVTMNRVKAKGFPSSVCAVVFQPRQFSWTHKKSHKDIQKALNGSTAHLQPKDRQAYHLAYKTAKKALSGVLLVPQLKDSLYFHAKGANPYWNSRFKKRATIGAHVFYSKG